MTFALAQASSSGKLSGAAIVAAVIAAVIALGCLAWGFARMSAYEPRWTLSLRHAVAEAGFRASATWAEFSDWLRLGR
jgi:O-antigen/teichoic acid export membrane protein